MLARPILTTEISSQFPQSLENHSQLKLKTNLYLSIVLFSVIRTVKRTQAPFTYNFYLNAFSLQPWPEQMDIHPKWKTGLV